MEKTPRKMQADSESSDNSPDNSKVESELLLPLSFELGSTISLDLNEEKLSAESSNNVLTKVVRSEELKAVQSSIQTDQESSATSGVESILTGYVEEQTLTSDQVLNESSKPLATSDVVLLSTSNLNELKLINSLCVDEEMSENRQESFLLDPNTSRETQFAESFEGTVLSGKQLYSSDAPVERRKSERTMFLEELDNSETVSAQVSDVSCEIDNSTPAVRCSTQVSSETIPRKFIESSLKSKSYRLVQSFKALKMKEAKESPKKSINISNIISANVFTSTDMQQPSVYSDAAAENKGRTQVISRTVFRKNYSEDELFNSQETDEVSGENLKGCKKSVHETCRPSIFSHEVYEMCRPSTSRYELHEMSRLSTSSNEVYKACRPSTSSDEVYKMCRPSDSEKSSSSAVFDGNKNTIKALKANTEAFELILGKEFSHKDELQESSIKDKMHEKRGSYSVYKRKHTRKTRLDGNKRSEQADKASEKLKKSVLEERQKMHIFFLSLRRFLVSVKMRSNDNLETLVQLTEFLERSFESVENASPLAMRDASRLDIPDNIQREYLTDLVTLHKKRKAFHKKKRNAEKGNEEMRKKIFCLEEYLADKDFSINIAHFGTVMHEAAMCKLKLAEVSRLMSDVISSFSDFQECTKIFINKYYAKNYFSLEKAN